MVKNIFIVIIFPITSVILIGSIIFELRFSPIILSLFILLSILTLIISVIKKRLTITIFSVILIFCISFFSFYVIKLQFIGYIFLLSIWLFCILISIVAIVKSINNKKNYFLNYILLISILFAFLGEVHVDYLYNYLEKEMLFIVNSIENYYGNKKYNASEIKNLLEIYEYKKIGTYYNDPNNGFYFIGIRRLHGKPLMNLSFYMNDDYYIISGITQILGIPYMEYDSREKTVNRNKVGNYLLYKKIL